MGFSKVVAFTGSFVWIVGEEPRGFSSFVHHKTFQLAGVYIYT